MSDIDASAAYDAVLNQLARQLPALHAQVVAEVERGREVNATQIGREDKASRNRELSSQQLGRLADSDLAAVELTEIERLMAVVRAIDIATRTHNASIRTLRRFSQGYNVSGGLRFRSPSDDSFVSAAQDEGEAPEREMTDDQQRASSIEMFEETAMVNREDIEAVLEELSDSDEHN